MKTIPKSENHGKSFIKEYVLLAGVSSIFVVLHKGGEMSLIHCFENVHFGPIVDMDFHKFSIYCVSNSESKVSMLKVNE